MMFSRVSRSALALAVCCSIGGQWIALQSIAWATMLVDYSQNCSFKQAIVQTFAGNRPCALCKHVSKGSANEKTRDKMRLATKADLICFRRAIACLPRFIAFEYPELTSSPVNGFHEPLSPPPRATLS
jgi:hypothetical protein